VGLLSQELRSRLFGAPQSLLISKVQAVLGAAILIVATAAVSAIVVSEWNPFPPKDYEDCAARAAKGAKSKDGLSVLLSICGSEFKARRKPGGDYAFYNSCQDRTVDIKGPNPTPAELNDIKQQCLSYIEAQEQIEAEQQRRAAELAEQKRRDQQAAQEARARQSQAEQEARAEASRAMQFRKSRTIANTDIVLEGAQCSYDADTCKFVKGKGEEPPIDITVRVTNRSNEALSGVTVGLAIIPQNGACPQSYAWQETLRFPLSPGESRVDKIYYAKPNPDFFKSRTCLRMLNVIFADK
jgi:hypothetical protein